jgi:methyl-accepting chemotaxis protein
MDINQAAQQAAAGAEQSEKAAQDLDKLGGDLEATVDQYKM